MGDLNYKYNGKTQQGRILQQVFSKKQHSSSIAKICKLNSTVLNDAKLFDDEYTGQTRYCDLNFESDEYEK